MRLRVVRVDGGYAFADAASAAAAARQKIGDQFVADVVKPRNNGFHKKFFALLRFAFDYWEPTEAAEQLVYRGESVQKSFKRFRHDVTILCGFYTPTYNARGEVRLEPRSISFSSMEPEEFEELFSTAIDVLLRMVMESKGFNAETLRRAADEIVRFDG